jgi:hypothetical protein
VPKLAAFEPKVTFTSTVGSIDGTTSGTIFADVKAALTCDALEGEIVLQVVAARASTGGIAVEVTQAANTDRMVKRRMEAIFLKENKCLRRRREP